MRMRGSERRDVRRLRQSCGLLFVPHDPVVVLSTSVTAAARMLPVLACVRKVAEGRGDKFIYFRAALRPTKEACFAVSRYGADAPMRPLPCETFPRSLRVFLIVFLTTA